jgi:hypothetical protein
MRRAGEAEPGISGVRRGEGLTRRSRVRGQPASRRPGDGVARAAGVEQGLPEGEPRLGA